MTNSPRRTGGSEQRKPLQFPLIPPLPPSNVYDKENQRQPEAQNRNSSNNNVGSHQKPAAAKRGLHSSSSLSLTPQSRSSSLGLKPYSANRESFLKSSPSQPVMRRHSQGSKRRVLRYGETIDSLFCLTENTSSQHQRLCRDIAEGPLADDASAWVRVVQAATMEVAKSADRSEKGMDLIRLHRRATSRFSALSDKDLRTDEDSIFELWLSYAGVQALYGSAEDARLTFRHIQNQSLGVSKAAYYLKFAEFERQYDSSRAIQILKAGLEQNAAPQQALYDAVKEIQKSTRLESMVRLEPEEMSGRDSLSKSPVRKLSSVVQSNKRKSEQEISPKRLKKNDGTAKVVMPTSQENGSLKQSNDVGPESNRPRSALNIVHRSHEKVSFAKGTALEPSRNKGHDTVVAKTPTRPPLSSGTARPAFGSVSVLKNSQKKPSSISKTPRLLSRVGLSGKPMRVNADENLATDSDSSMDTASQSETIDAKALLENIADSMDITSTKPVPKISKMDLSYMLNWDPNSRGRPSTSPKREHTEMQTESACDEDGPGKESAPSPAAPSNGSTASLVTSTMTSVHSNAGVSMHTHRSDGSDEVNLTNQPTASLDQTAILVAKSNPDFLPLVSEDNILRINSVPYAKLGVIGKGGSCKVYRALAKDCSILAIKKVKLAGMDKKAINGYANEIALLKRLRGNPAIIQMYDSEVDLSRKAIFVAMELGEVDLNQVIQQQTLGHNKDGKSRSSLDMNFIRLTWQQMLKAVHSIHEERIIHGDLKPANFLFVRGALKLIDFGIAKAIQSDDTTNIYRDSQIGTLNYMSPEAILDTGSSMNGARMKIGRASDIWSLGCILYQMIYGRTPFADLHMIQKLQAIVNPSHKITFPSGVEDEGAVDAMKQCLRRTADERPPIIGENGLLNEHCFLNTRHLPHET